MFEIPNSKERDQIEEFERLTDESYMRMALEEAKLAASKGEVPVGAIVVHQPFDKGSRKLIGNAQIVGRGRNMREASHDASAHAELIAMREAMKELGAWRLEDCTVYVTLEPCIMCAGLMHQSRIKACVFGAFDPKAGACGSLYDISSDLRLNHRFDVESGILEEECADLLRDFFRSRR